MFGGIFNVAKWKLLLFLFIGIIGAFFILQYLPSIMANAQMTDIAVLPAMGMFGGALTVVSCVYFAETLKKGDMKSAFMYGMVGVVLGFALVIAWLW
jgi:hypothetical protein